MTSVLPLEGKVEGGGNVVALNLDIEKTRPTPQSNGGLLLGFRVRVLGLRFRV